MNSGEQDAYERGFRDGLKRAAEIAVAVQTDDSLWGGMIVGWTPNPGPGRVERRLDLRPSRAQMARKIAKAIVSQ